MSATFDLNTVTVHDSVASFVKENERQPDANEMLVIIGLLQLYSLNDVVSRLSDTNQLLDTIAHHTA